VTTTTSETNDEIEIAWRIADQAHIRQFRRDGITPYLDHIADVEMRVRQRNRDHSRLKHMQVLAILHDVKEDSNITDAELSAEGISEEVIQDLDLLNHEKGTPYTDYIARMLATCPEVENSFVGQWRAPVVEVKICDILANLSDNPTNKQILKYSQALLRLADTTPQA
jgi:(p)ppGpp synthase/HD superfamily hydrolase